MCQEVRQWQLVGDFNPSEKYAGQIGNLAQFSGCNIPKILGKFHHKKKHVDVCNLGLHPHLLTWRIIPVSK